MNISGVLVQIHPRNIHTVKSRLLARAGVEIHASTNTGSLVVTIETDTPEQLANALTDLQLMPGVLCANMVYHHIEEPPLVDSPPSQTTSPLMINTSR